jgi:aspartyl-tRNA(Asn)/glutamyl-tRNA(Gln) amidotransferase subunit C
MPSDPPAARPIDEAEVRSIARLAHLDLPDDEIQRLTTDLASILAYVQQLEELDVSGVAPTASVLLERLPLRPDAPHESLSHELALREAPRVTEDGFEVPAFVDEG